MSEIHVSEHLQEMEQFLKQSDKLRTVLNNMNDLNKVDRNDLYELVYSKKSIEKWLEKDIENKDIEASLHELLESINLVLKSLTDDTLKEIVDRKIHDGKKVEEINKLKYANKKQYKGLVDKEKLIAERRKSTLQLYFAKRLPAFIMFTVVYFLLVSGKLPEISQNITRAIVSVVDSSIEETVEVDTEHTDIDVEQIVTNVEQSTNSVGQIIADTEQLTGDVKSVESFTGALSTILSIILILICFTLVMTTCLDMLYVAMPMFRMMFDKFASDDAKKLVELQSYSPVTQVHKVIDYRDKFEVATALINNILDYLEELQRFNLTYNTNKKSYKKIDDATILLINKVKDIKSQIKSDNILLKVEALVDAEMIYLDNKNSIDANESKDKEFFKNYKDKNLAQNILRI